jgi:TonB family protein
MPAGPESIPQLAPVRLFAVDQIGSRLTSDPALVSRFWDLITKPVSPAQPDLTVLYCLVRYLGRTFTLLEFVAGETLEDLVRRYEPSALLQELPLFGRILDAFEGGGEGKKGATAPSPDFELVDFGIAGAPAAGIARIHGAAMAGPGGSWSEQFFSASAVGWSEAGSLLKELCTRLPGGLRPTGPYSIEGLGACSIRSLSPVKPSSKPVLVIETPPVRSGLLARSARSPVTIGVGTAALVLAMLSGVGGFLARRRVPANAGQLIPATAAPLPVEVPIQPTPPEAFEPPAEEAEKPAPPSRKRAPVRQPVGKVVVTRGARPLRQTKLLYPDEAKKERISGVVEMQITIAEDGSVKNQRVLSGDPLLRAGLSEQISKWIYQPLRVNGKPVPMTTELAIRFDLTP